MKKFAVQLAILWLAAVVPAVIAAFVHPRRPSWSGLPPLIEGDISLADATRPGRDVLWVDARDLETYRRAHIPGAIQLNEDRWDAQLQLVLYAWRPGRAVVVYCDGGRCNTARRVAQRFRDETGLTDIFALQGGWEAWQRQLD